jgi:hypothetical protein
MPKDYKDKDEFLDGLFDHVFPESDYPDGVDEEDEKFFDHIASFFESDEGDKGGTGSGASAPRRRRRPASTGTSPRRRRQTASSSSGYGSDFFFRK